MSLKNTKTKQGKTKNPVKRNPSPSPAPVEPTVTAMPVTVAPTVVLGAESKPRRGRPTAYHPGLCEEILEFFDVEYTREIEISHTNSKGETWTESKTIANHVPQVMEFSRKIGVCRDTIYEWAKQHPEFSDALTRAQEMGESMTVSNAMMGFYNPNFTQLVMKNRYGWKDKKDLDVPGGLKVTIDSSDAGL